MGRPRRQLPVVDLHACRLDSRRRRVQQEHAEGIRRPGARRARPALRELYPVHARHLQSLRPHGSRAAGRRRGPEHRLAGHRLHSASADPVHGLRRIFRGLRLRYSRLAQRPPRRRLGSLVAALGQCRLGDPDHRYRAGKLVGLLRVGLGWLVGLGSGGKSTADHLAVRRGADPFAGGDRKAPRVQELDGIARDPGFRRQPARHFHHAIGPADLSARLCQRSFPGGLHSRHSRRFRRRRLAALCDSRAPDQERVRLRFAFPGDFPARQ